MFFSLSAEQLIKKNEFSCTNKKTICFHQWVMQHGLRSQRISVLITSESEKKPALKNQIIRTAKSVLFFFDTAVIFWIEDHVF